jgi:phospholipid-translocating ATPase
MAPSTTGLDGLFKSIASFNVATLFSRKRPAGRPRTVFVNRPTLPPEYLDKNGRPKPEDVYTPNQVITSKYNLITFIPRNLIEQFRRVANMYVP